MDDDILAREPDLSSGKNITMFHMAHGTCLPASTEIDYALWIAILLRWGTLS